tara:strand:+ start:422 stop:1762 length:1341 start_codon:yes stop_codon:yes gene_type:complete
MYKLLFRSFFRTKIFLVSLSLLLFVGIISILIGKQYLLKQEKTIAAAVSFQQKSIQNNIKYHNEDLGLVLYYLRFTLIKKPVNLSAISIGQSDVNPLLQSVTIRNLEGQKHDTDFENPALLMSGNLDLGFVIIYLFPLVLIAMTFNLYSEEKELGTWRILSTQTTSKLSFLLKKMGIRILFIFAVLIVLLIAAIFVLRIPLDYNFWALCMQSFIYILFWCALCLIVISFQANSNFNALTLISIWIVLTILLPAMVNNYVLNKYPVPEALDAMIEQRDGYHEKWDLAKGVTMEPFFEDFPHFKKYIVPEDKFSWIWYYGMQYMGDLESKESSIKMSEKIRLRNKISETIALVLPTIHTQLVFNKMASTNMIAHLDFIETLTKFHEKLRVAFYSDVFDKRPADSIDWGQYDVKFYEPNTNFNLFKTLSPTLLITILIGLVAIIKLKRL